MTSYDEAARRYHDRALYDTAEIRKAFTDGWQASQSGLSPSERAEVLAVLEPFTKAEHTGDDLAALSSLAARLRSVPRESPYSDGKEWGSMFKIGDHERGVIYRDEPAPPEPAQGEGLSDKIAWAILQALHENVPEDERPMSWSDMRGDQAGRIRAAAHAAMVVFAQSDFIPAVQALSSLPPAGDTVAVPRARLKYYRDMLAWTKCYQLAAEISRLLDGRRA